MPRDPLHSYLPSWSPWLLHGRISISPAPGSLSGAHSCEACISIASLQLPPSPEAGLHCQTTAVGCVRGSVHWAPSVQDCLCPWAVKLAQLACLCDALSAREQEQSRTCAEWHGATVSCLSLLLARCVSCTSLFQTVRAGQGKSH